MKTLMQELELSDDRPDLTPRIDCVFLLLLFFVVTAVFSEEARLFEVQLPTAEQSQVRTLDDALVVWISADGDYSIGQKLVAEDQLWNTMKALHEQQAAQTLVIKGDRRSPYEQVVRVHDIGRHLGIESVVFAVDQR
jgi:biopolymer transport protein ExbD